MAPFPRLRPGRLGHRLHQAYRIEQRMREAGAPLVKAVDFEVSRKTAEPADLLLAGQRRPRRRGPATTGCAMA